MRDELFWDRDAANVSPEVEIERAINFGGFDFIQHVQDRHGMERFTDVLMHSRNLSCKAVNYWCLVLGLDRDKARVFNMETVWSPFR